MHVLQIDLTNLKNKQLHQFKVATLQTTMNITEIFYCSTEVTTTGRM